MRPDASLGRAYRPDLLGHIEWNFISTPSSPFTRWVVRQRLLSERLVVIDAGCQGGVHVQWDLLGDLGEVHAFDAIKEAVEDLVRREVRPNRHYYNIALGNEDGRRKFFVKPNVFSSSFIAEDNRARFVPYGRDIVCDPQLEPLDTEFLERGGRSYHRGPPIG